MAMNEHSLRKKEAKMAPLGLFWCLLYKRALNLPSLVSAQFLPGTLNMAAKGDVQICQDICPDQHRHPLPQPIR